MDGFTTIALGGVNGLNVKSVDEQKYAIIFVKTGNAGTFFSYSASYHEIHKEITKVSMNMQTKDDVSEKLRAALVGSVRHGKTLVFDIGNQSGEILAYQPSGETVWPADKIWSFAEWRKEDNHMQIVRDDENKDMQGNPKQYVLNPSFTIFILASWESEEKANALLNIIPHIAELMKFVI